MRETFDLKLIMIKGQVLRLKFRTRICVLYAIRDTRRI